VYPEVKDTRGITVTSHLLKVIEKVIKNRLDKEQSLLLRTGEYQTGFKEGKSTINNLKKVM
jgi:hypothetical protein